MTRRGLAILSVLVLTSTTRADEFVHLSGFDSEAAILNNRATGRANFRLSAGVIWSKTAPRTQSRYSLRLVLPNQRTINQPLGEQEGPGSSRLTIDIPAESVRNLIPGDVVVHRRAAWRPRRTRRPG